VLTSTLILVWGGYTNFSGKNVQNQGHDDSLYLLNLGMSDPLMSTPASADQSFLLSSIARVVPRRGQWSRARRSLLLYDELVVPSSSFSVAGSMIGMLMISGHSI